MKRFAFATVACFALTLIATSGAFAGLIPPQVTLSSGSVGTVDFTVAGGGINVTFTGSSGLCTSNCISGTAFLDLNTGLPGSVIQGQYWLWIVNGPITLSGGPNAFAVNMNAATVYLAVELGTGGALGSLLTTVNLTDVLAGGSPSNFTATFDGTDTTSMSTLDFLPIFTPSGGGTIDFTVKFSQPAAGYVSSGEVIPTTTPEPGTLALLGSGVLGLAGLLRRKTK
jgi:hypothetical protein